MKMFQQSQGERGIRKGGHIGVVIGRDGMRKGGDRGRHRAKSRLRSDQDGCGRGGRSERGLEGEGKEEENCLERCRYICRYVMKRRFCCESSPLSLPLARRSGKTPPKKRLSVYTRYVPKNSIQLCP